MSADPYEVLGVSRGASAAKIRRHYLQRARKAHPDRGGSHEEMSGLNQAYALLGNEVSRARFDRGESAAPPPLEHQAIQLLCQCFQVGLEKCEPEADLMAWMRTALKSQAADRRSQQSQTRKEVARCERRLKKLTCRSGPDFLGDLLRQRIAAAQGLIEQFEQHQEVCARAQELLQQYSSS